MTKEFRAIVVDPEGRTVEAVETTGKLEDIRALVGASSLAPPRRARLCHGENGGTDAMTRACGDCQLCCKLLPVPPLQKRGGETCRFQKFHKGCTVYHKPEMPIECSLWNCRWLVNDDTDELSRPDRSHYVIDVMPDFITIKPDDGGEPQNIQVAQVWVDTRHRDAHRDPALRRWMIRRAEQGIAALIRFNQRDAIVVFAPPFDAGGEWHEITSGMKREPTHTFAETMQALGGEARMVVTDDDGTVHHSGDLHGDAGARRHLR